MMTPYEKQFLITKANTADMLVALDYPSRVFITKVIATHADPAKSMSITLFNSDVDGMVEHQRAPFKVIPTQSGNNIIEYWPEQPVPFFSLEEPNHLGNRRRIYINLDTVYVGEITVTIGSYSVS